jgi:hypothetical protein
VDPNFPFDDWILVYHLQVFQYHAEEIAAGTVQRPQASRNLGLSLIALGTLALAAATWQHRKFSESYRRIPEGPQDLSLSCRSDGRHPDRVGDVLRRFAEKRIALKHVR